MAMDLIAGRGLPPGPGPAPGGGGPPPDLAALLGGGAPPGPPEPPPTPGGSPQDEADALDAIAAAIDAYLALPTVDESEKLVMEKCSTAVQQLKAQNQKSADNVTGASPTLRKALAGGAGGAAPAY